MVAIARSLTYAGLSSSIAYFYQHLESGHERWVIESSRSRQGVLAIPDCVQEGA